jgi:hypothetical protein
MNHKIAVLLKRYAREEGKKYDEVRTEWLRANWRERTKRRQEMEAVVEKEED